MKNFIYKGTKYRITVKPNNSPSNYNRSVAVFKTGDKMALIGWVCKETTPINELINHFKISWERHQREQIVL